MALIESGDCFEATFGLRAAESFCGFVASGAGDVSPAWLERLRATPGVDPWIHGLAVAQREGGLVIGGAAFKGPPDEEGTLEIAYGIVPGYQGRGYATEAAAALVAFAFDSGCVRVVRAHTLPKPNASTRVLTKCGFKHTGEVMDPEDGLVWRWERNKELA